MQRRFCLRQHGTIRSYVYGFSALRAEKPYTYRNQVSQQEIERNRAMTTSAPQTGYAPVNGLQMYYEIHGTGGHPLVLLHGAFSAIGTSFDAILPGLAKTRQVIAFELQAHGRTADIDRPLSIEQM